MTHTQNIPELISVRWWKKTQQHKSKQSLKIADLISSSILFNPLTTATSELDHIKSAVLKKKKQPIPPPDSSISKNMVAKTSRFCRTNFAEWQRALTLPSRASQRTLGLLPGI